MLHIYGVTDRGMVREANEDRFAGEVFDRGSGYAVVCDGMGGEVGGGIAAGIAAEEVRRMIESSLRPHMEERSLHLLLQTAIDGANRAVFTRSRQSGGALDGMGSTLCAAVVSDGTALVANVGDSRCYLLREGELFPLILSLPTGSMREFSRYIKRLLSKGKKSNMVVTRFSLKKATNASGIAYSQAQFTIDRPLTSEEQILINRLSEQVKQYSRRVGFDTEEPAEAGPLVDPETGEIVEPLQ